MKKILASILVIAMVALMIPALIIPVSAWTGGPEIANIGTSSEAAGYEGTKIFDNNPDTMWHIPWQAGVSKQNEYPHVAIVEFDKAYWIDCVGYLPRNSSSPNGTFVDIEIWVSAVGSVDDIETNVGWTKVASKQWDGASWDDLGNRTVFHNIEFTAVEAKLVKFVVLEGVSGYASGAAIEFGFLGVDYTPMDGFTPKSAPGTPVPNTNTSVPETTQAPTNAPGSGGASTAPPMGDNDGIIVLGIMLVTAIGLISCRRIAGKKGI